MNAFWPEQASNFATDVDYLYLVLIGLTLFFSIIVFVPIIVMVMKYRQGTKADRSNVHHHNLRLELTWTIIPLLMGLPVFWWGADLYTEMYSPIEGGNVLSIDVVGKQWMWHLQHPTGQRENNELHIPVGRPVRLRMISQDVLHAFFVPAFRVKKDVIPGTYHEIWFEATKVGKYHLFCAEFCGTKHSEMTGYVTVMEPEDYEQWLEETKWGTNNLIATKAKPETTAEAGERLFVETGCANCHGPKDDGQFVSLMGIYGSDRRLEDGRIVNADDDYIRMSIYQPDAMKVAGHDADMPSFKGQLDEQQVMQLIAYIRTLKNGQPVAATVTREESR
jgi:cytochrome c oxidase subunit 2